MKVGDICFYKPQKIRKSQFNHIIFVIGSHEDEQYWCGWFDYDNVWRGGLIPGKSLEIIND